MNEVEIRDEKAKLGEDLANHDREFAVLNTLIDYLSNRDDEKDPSPDFKKQEDYGFISDAIVVLFALHPLLVRWMPNDDNLGYLLSKYLRDKVNVHGDYTQEQCLENLKAFRAEKELQYEDLKRAREELGQAKE